MSKGQKGRTFSSYLDPFYWDFLFFFSYFCFYFGDFLGSSLTIVFHLHFYKGIEWVKPVCVSVSCVRSKVYV